MKLKIKMYVTYGLIVVFLSIFAFTIISEIFKLHNSSNQIVEGNYQNVKTSTLIRIETEKMSRVLREILVDHQRENLDQAKKELKDSRVKIQDALHTLKHNSKSHSSREIVQQAEVLFTSYLEVEERVITYVKNNQLEEAINELENKKTIRDSLLANINEIITLQENNMENILLDADEAFDSTAKLIIISLLTGISLISATTYWVIKSFGTRIGNISKAIRNFDITNLEVLPRIEKVKEDEMSEFVEAFNTMAQTLEEQAMKEKQLRKVLEEEGWLKSILVEFSVMFQDTRTLDSLTNSLISKLCPMLKALYGVIYLVKEDEERSFLEKSAAYAHDGTDLGISSFQLGQGLVGQCALEKRNLVLGDLQEESFLVSTALGNIKPKKVLVYPIIYENKVLAVMELGIMKDLSDLKARIIEQVLDNAGANIYTILGKMKVERLLRESQHLTEELQTQAEELQSQSEELKVQQEELISTHEKLERHHKMTEQKSIELERAKKVLEEQAEQLTQTSKYKSEFLANMSHELRTPLNSMLILTQMLVENQQENLTSEQVKWAETIQMSGRELLLLINDILDVSKLEAGRMELNLGVNSTESLTTYVDQLFRPMANAKGLEFKIKVSQDFPHNIFTDLERLKQVLANLVSNAFKFTEKGCVMVELFYISIEKKLGIAVTDTGIGIPSEKQGLIFDAFRQADGTTSRRYGGTGLGLAICKDLTNLLGGEIKVSSMVGQGSTFLVTLPHHQEYVEKEIRYFSEVAVTEEKEGGTPGSKDYNKDVKGTYNLAGYKVLIADDDMRNIFALTTILENQEMEVYHAENGKQAIKVLAENPDINLVLMDIMMPEMDGYQAIRAIRTVGHHESLPIIALTAKAAKNDREKCLEAGASDYISKPVNLDQLLSLIQVWLFNRG